MKKCVLALIGVVLFSVLVGCTSTQTTSSIDSTDGVNKVSNAVWKLNQDGDPSFEKSGAERGDEFEFSENSDDGLVKRNGDPIATFTYSVDNDSGTLEIDFIEDSSYPTQYQYSYSGDFDTESGQSHIMLTTGDSSFERQLLIEAE